MSAIDRMRRLERTAHIRPRPLRQFRTHDYTIGDGDLPPGTFETPIWSNERWN